MTEEQHNVIGAIFVVMQTTVNLAFYNQHTSPATSTPFLYLYLILNNKMKKYLVLIAILFSTSLTGYCQNNSSAAMQQQKVIQKFIAMVAHQQVAKLAALTQYPLRRQYPLPAIKNKEDMIKRYKEVFDDSIVKAITTSDPKNDWSEVGWRGIMLFNGDIWLDDKGRLITVNYQNKGERIKREQIIAAERMKLHVSLRQYIRPVLILETKKYRIRIDEMAEGEYRYASWPLTAKAGDKPELIINKGQLDFDGTGGNHSYKFTNAGYTYECYVDEMGATTFKPAELTIFNGDKQILKQQGKVLIP